MPMNGGVESFCGAHGRSLLNAFLSFGVKNFFALSKKGSPLAGLFCLGGTISAFNR
jgi:hypothetical protein